MIHQPTNVTACAVFGNAGAIPVLEGRGILKIECDPTSSTETFESRGTSCKGHAARCLILNIHTTNGYQCSSSITYKPLLYTPRSSFLHLWRVHDRFVIRFHILVDNQGERAEDGRDVAPPPVTVALVPVHGDLETLLEGGLLCPAELLELGSIDGVSVVVEGAVVGVLDPLLELGRVLVVDAHLGEELVTECDVGDFVVRADVVDLTHLALVEDGVEGVGGVSGVEISACWAAISVEDHGLAAV